jgi:hypothetical protein
MDINQTLKLNGTTHEYAWLDSDPYVRTRVTFNRETF